jgi:hypothetical protein
MFVFIEVLAALIPLAFVVSFWWEHVHKGWNWITDDGRKMYTDAANTLVTASGIAVAVIVSRLDSKDETILHTTKEAVVCLIICIVFSVITILALSRGFEMAQSRYTEGGNARGQGQLTPIELLFILVPTFVALTGFLEGFLFLGRIAFQL